MKLADFTEERAARASNRDVSGYVVDGARVPSVTEVLDLAQLSNIREVIRVAGAEVVAHAADRGRRVHIYCELVDREEAFRLEAVPADVRGYVQAYQRFVIETGFVPELIEEPMVSSSLRFAGTVDRVGTCRLLDGLHTFDLKTPASDDPAWPIQTAGYALLVDENYGMRTRRHCVQLRPNGRFKIHSHPSETDYRIFRAALEVAHFRLAHGLGHLED